ncbi:dephospho-CoA kinase [Rothia aerolata]|uniref:Dephospho-CoA kinase n=1 Tax=Rothia aerolata TaxID=1812262 RepID=A0A917MRZ0_9MICC|nr:dephospho-CoA kinase [Rothia aerolata]GGH57072.1 dephospho-CoA kinase [Rothia aerolata]
MKRIGLTGGIGSGKSTVAKMFEEMGAVIIDADQISRDLMRPGSPVLAQVAETFGNQILTNDGHLIRPELAKIVFSDSQAREKLNSIVHPAVRRHSAQLAEEAQAAPDFSGVIIEDIPLLAETGQAHRFDAVVVVEVEPDIRLQRLVQQRGMAEDDARARMATQASDERRREIATWVVDNSRSLDDTRAQVEQIYSRLQDM